MLKNFTVVQIFILPILRQASGYHSAGVYSKVWQPLNLASGVYFYRLQTGELSIVRKMMYLK